MYVVQLNVLEFRKSGGPQAIPNDKGHSIKCHNYFHASLV